MDKSGLVLTCENTLDFSCRSSAEMTDALCLTFILVGTAFSFISFVAPNPSSLQLLIHIRNSSASLGYFYISRAKNHGVALRNPPHLVCSGKNNTPSPILILKWDRESFNKGLGDWNVGGDNGGVKGTDDSGMKMEAFIFYLDLCDCSSKTPSTVTSVSQST